jgi:hypothetical protein
MNAEILGSQSHGSLSIVEFVTPAYDTFKYSSYAQANGKSLAGIELVRDVNGPNAFSILNTTDSFVFLREFDGFGPEEEKLYYLVDTSILISPKSQVQISDTYLHWQWSPVHLPGSPPHVDDSNPNVRKSLRIEQRLDEFAEVSGANGCAVFFTDKLVRIELFNAKSVYANLFKDILSQAASTWPILNVARRMVTKENAGTETLAQLNRYEQVEVETGPGLGAGVNGLFNTGDMSGRELMNDTHLVHLTMIRNQEVHFYSGT